LIGTASLLDHGEPVRELLRVPRLTPLWVTPSSRECRTVRTELP
jgi:hypothetical protein